MKEIRQHIKDRSFSTVYLLYGDEGYQVAQARLLLKKALVRDHDDMNYIEYTSARPDMNEIRENLMTFPFFAEKRVVLLNKTGIMKTGKDDLVGILEQVPSTSVLIIVENEVDKRSKAYKWIRKNGCVAEYMKKNVREADLVRFVGSLLKRGGKKIRTEDAVRLVRKVGTDMFELKNETDKLIAYAGPEEVITAAAIDAVISDEVTDKIFELVDAVAVRDRPRVLARYQDLILLKEAPLRILSLLIRQFRILLKLYDMSRQHFPEDEMASRAGIMKFALRKYLGQLRHYNEDALVRCLNSCISMEEDIKSGKISDQIGVESMLTALS